MNISVLVKKVTFPRGTALHRATKTEHYDCLVASVALGEDAIATLIIHPDDPGVKKWLAKVDA